MEQFFNSLCLKSQIGVGGFGKIFLARNQESCYAVKAVSKSKGQAENVAREVQAGKMLNHKNITNFVCEYEDEWCQYMVFDYIKGNDLFSFLEKRGFQTFTETESRNILKQVLSAIAYCHENGVVHFDLKLDNIMINPETHEVSIIDFGLCDFVTEENGGKFTRRVGSEEYCPPELLQNTNRPFDGKKVDSFCLGVVLYALLTATFPFDVKKRRQAIKSGLASPAYKMPAVSEECKDLLSRMLESNPEKRITIEQVLSHPWVSQL